MGDKTEIEWCDATWNPVRGCSLVSPGCKHCYAMKQAHRFSGPGKAYEGLTELGPDGPRWTGAVRAVPELLGEPLKWRKPRRVFVNSMSDLFHEGVPDEFIARVWTTMAGSPEHIFQILTKRPERMRDWVSRCANWDGWWTHNGAPVEKAYDGDGIIVGYEAWPLPNVWLGVSAEDQKTADERIPLLLQTPAAVRFVSAEPLLGPINLESTLWNHVSESVAMQFADREDEKTARLSRLLGLDWVIVGGESGPGARPMDVAWARSILEQCRAAGVPAFCKQLGRFPYDTDNHWITRGGGVVIPVDSGYAIHEPPADRKGGSPSEWPEDLRVREFPEVPA